MPRLHAYAQPGQWGDFDVDSRTAAPQRSCFGPYSKTRARDLKYWCLFCCRTIPNLNWTALKSTCLSCFHERYGNSSCRRYVSLEKRNNRMNTVYRANDLSSYPASSLQSRAPRAIIIISRTAVVHAKRRSAGLGRWRAVVVERWFGQVQGPVVGPCLVSGGLSCDVVGRSVGFRVELGSTRAVAGLRG